MPRISNCSCSVCGTAAYRRPSQLAAGAVYCSRACSGVAQRIDKTCPVCGKTYWGEKKTCSRACANRSRTGIRYDGTNTRNNAAKGWHRKEQVAAERGGRCETCGHDNYNILQIHHVVPKAVGGTDELSNLRLLCPNCHMTEHAGHAFYGGSSR